MYRFLLYILIFLQSSIAHSYIIVSDYDDTMKVANVENHVDVVVRGTLSNRLFIGVPEVYQGLTEWGQLYVVSGSPSLLRSKIAKNLKYNGIPATLILKPIQQTDLYNFKLNTLRQLQKKNNGPYVLIGDDTQHDPEIFIDFKNEFPTLVEAIYIRKVTGRELPTQVVPFYTSYELAFYEFNNRRISEDYLKATEAAIQNVIYGLELFPLFSVCPSNKEDIYGYQQMNQKLIKKIVSMCN